MQGKLTKINLDFNAEISEACPIDLSTTQQKNLIKDNQAFIKTYLGAIYLSG